MGEYALFVFGACAVCAVCGYVAYRRGGAERLALSVLLLYAVAMPLLSLAEGWDGELRLPEAAAPEDADAEYIKTAEQAFEIGVARQICEKYSLPAESVSVRCYGFDFDSMRAESIKVALSGRAAAADYKAIEKYVESLGLGECDVEIDIG